MTLDDIKTIDEAVDDAAVALREFMKQVVPARKFILANQSVSLPTEDYVSIRIFTTPEEGEQVIYEVKDDGSETHIFHHTVVFQVKFYKGKAYNEALKCRQAFKIPKFRYAIFGSNPLVGYQSASTVQDDPTPIDGQQWEQGATFLVNLSILARVSDEGLGDIGSVNVNYTVN